MLRFIFIAKGIGIVLVLLFHFGPANWWTPFYTQLGGIVYKHHMPLFMCLSGFVFNFKRLPTHTFVEDYKSYAKKKSLRLLLPYVSVSAIYAGMKLVGQGFFSHRAVDYSTLLATFINPAKGLASLLWFLYVLFIYLMITPLLLKVFSKPQLFLISIVMCFIPVNIDIVNRLCRFFSMFVMGMLLKDYQVIDRVHTKVAITMCAVTFTIVCLIDQAPFLVTNPINALLGGISGTLFWIFISKWLTEIDDSRTTKTFEYLGKHSAEIYLIHQPFVWLAPVILHTQCKWDANSTLLALPFSLALGLCVPIMLEQQVLRRSWWLSTLILGVPPQKTF